MNSDEKGKFEGLRFFGSASPNLNIGTICRNGFQTEKNTN